MALIPSLTADEVDANDRRKQDLVALIASGDAVLFVGAGSSKMVGFPLWTDLIHDLEGLATQCGAGFQVDADILRKDPSAFLAYVDTIRAHIRGATGNDDMYLTFLTRTFSSEENPFTPLDMHRQMVRLPFRGIITTNYDFVLEAALISVAPESGHRNSLDLGIDPPYLIHGMLQRLTKAGAQRQVLHIHGCNRSPGRIVLGLLDYEAAYADGSLLLDVMRVILTSYRLVFVGFSLTDPYFRGLLERVASRFQLKGLPVHYAAADITPSDATDQKARAHQLKLEYSTEVVFYERLDDTHRGLRDLIREIEQAILIKAPYDGIEALNDAVAAEIIR